MDFCAGRPRRLLPPRLRREQRKPGIISILVAIGQEASYFVAGVLAAFFAFRIMRIQIGTATSFARLLRTVDAGAREHKQQKLAFGFDLLCRAYAERNGIQVVAIFDDRAVSGACVHQRGGLQKLLAAATQTPL